MKKIIALTAALSLIIAVSANAQKLANVQEKSMRAPATIKIDGKRPEWVNQIQADNKSTGISYTISNDDDKLYLVAVATDVDIANKIINAGLTFTINGSGKVKDEGGMSVTYPFLYKEDCRNDLPLLDYNKEITVWNQQLNEKIKDIRVAGIKGVKDTISIYNAEGIKVATLFDEDKVFTYELAIPLKYLGLSVKDRKPIVYTIKLNGIPNYHPLGNFDVINGVQAPSGRTMEATSAIHNQSQAFNHLRPYLRKGIKGMHLEGSNYFFEGPSAAMVISLISPTWFSGEYTLAK